MQLKKLEHGQIKHAHQNKFKKVTKRSQIIELSKERQKKEEKQWEKYL